jgi:integrase
LVAPTARTTGSTRQFLAALHAFYREAERLGFYPHAAPLIDQHRLERHRAEQAAGELAAPPRMPAISGVEAPRPRYRLTARYFVQVADAWVPQTINDPQFPSRVLGGGRSLACWGLREECVTRLLFETGARLSEVVGLTLGGWQRKGLQQDAWTFNKGSQGRWTKVLHFRQDTAKLLRRYLDGERAQADPAHRTLDHYLRLAAQTPDLLRSVPLFLSHRGTPYSGTLYREHYWQPACRAAGIQARPHQTRHWYVTRFLEHVHATATGAGELAQGKRDLIAYMHWAAGEETMAAYDHVFDAARHAALADQLHATLYADLDRAATPRRPTAPPAPSGGVAEEEDAEYHFLLSLGGAHDG